LSYWAELIPVILVLVLLISLLLALRRGGFARFSILGSATTRKSGQQIGLLDRRVLTAQHTLYLVEVDRVRLLLGGSPASFQLIAVLPQDNRNAFSTERVEPL
jgi:flagellar biogenesis protein FliO